MFSHDDIYVYIFSWKRVSNQSPDLFRAVKKAFSNTTFINCDEHMSVPVDITPCIQRDDTYYYGGQFETAIRDCPPGKILCCIVGDVDASAPWEAIRDNCLITMNTGRAGIYAPNVDWTPHIARGSQWIGPLFHVPNTDCTCWFIHPAIVDTLRPIEYMTLSNIGWGIDTIAIEEAKKRTLVIVRDYSTLVRQPKSRGYSGEEGIAGMKRIMAYYSEYYTSKNTTPNDRGK
jgi:hypothetical protein